MITLRCHVCMRLAACFVHRDVTMGGGARAEMHMHTAAYIGKAAHQTIERDDNQFLDAAAQA